MARIEDERGAAADGDEADALARAAALDAEGRHTEAIDVLAGAARRGGAKAKGRVGARILIGDRAPTLPAQGAGLIEEAARQGDAEAAALAAVLAGAGAYRRQSWEDALDWLARAAAAGHAPSRRQLVLLSHDKPQPDDASPETWSRLRAAVDLARLLAPPEGQTLCPEPLIRHFPGFASDEICAWLVERARDGLTRATVYEQNPHDRHVSEMRTNSIRLFSLVEHDLVQLLLQARMAAATGIPFAHMEAISVLHYAEGQEITEHFDFISPGTPDHAQHLARYGERVVTFLVYLNDDYAGGETEFPRLGVSHKGARGEGLFFSNARPSGEPDLRSLHAGRPPGRGEKWIVSQFIRNRPFIPGAGA
jgi:hypothetical protein